jgi:ankyrin repeat protein
MQCTRGFEDLVVELVRRGADINAQGEYKNTPLHLACSNNHKAIVSFLLMVRRIYHSVANLIPKIT